MAGIASQHTLPAQFEHYELDDSHHEMIDSCGRVRHHYQHLYQTLLNLPGDELSRRQRIADLSFLHQGITFTVYGREEGAERIFPNESADPQDTARRAGLLRRLLGDAHAQCPASSSVPLRLSRA